jgi:hypothetical protein
MRVDVHGAARAGRGGTAVLPDGAIADRNAVSYDIYAIGDPAQDVTKYRVRFPRFQLGDHNGTLVTADGASQVQYRAARR